MTAAAGTVPRYHPARWARKRNPTLTVKSKAKNNYGAVILCCCFLAYFVMVGMVNSTSSLFIVPVSQTYGFSRAAFSVTISLTSLGSAIINIFYGKLYARFGIRRLMSFGFLASGVAFVLMSRAASLPVFYLGGLLASIGLGLNSNTSMALLINSWFTRRQGTLLGLISASSGLGGFVFSTLFAFLIANHGYQSAYICTAIILLVMVIPTVIIIREKEVPGEEGGQRIRSAMGEKGYFHGFWLLLKQRPVRFMLISTFILGLIVHSTLVASSAHMQINGISPVTSGIIYGGAYFSMGVFKVLMGYAHDRWGLKMAAITGVLGFVASAIVLIFVHNAVLGWVYILFAGLGTATESVLTPLMARNVLSNDNFRKYLGIYSAALTSGISVGVPIINAVYDIFGTYIPGFLAYCAVALFVLYMILSSINPVDEADL